MNYFCVVSKSCLLRTSHLPFHRRGENIFMPLLSFCSFKKYIGVIWMDTKCSGFFALHMCMALHIFNIVQQRVGFGHSWANTGWKLSPLGGQVWNYAKSILLLCEEELKSDSTTNICSILAQTSPLWKNIVWNIPCYFSRRFIL